MNALFPQKWAHSLFHLFWKPIINCTGSYQTLFFLWNLNIISRRYFECIFDRMAFFFHKQVDEWVRVFFLNSRSAIIWQKLFITWVKRAFKCCFLTLSPHFWSRICPILPHFLLSWHWGDVKNCSEVISSWKILWAASVKGQAHQSMRQSEWKNWANQLVLKVFLHFYI